MLSSPERIEVEAYADAVAAAPAGFPAQLARSGAAIAMRIDGAPLTELNRIVGLSTLGELYELEPLYEGGQVVVSLDPTARLDGELEARGFAPGYAWQKFARGVEPYVSHTRLEIAEAEGPGEFGPAVATAFGAPASFGAWLDELLGRPGWHLFVSRSRGACVGGGALFASGETGWLGIAGTLPDARGQGSQGAVFAARIDRARELGLTELITETGVPRDGQPGPSYRNMLRVGFQPIYVRPNYVRP